MRAAWRRSGVVAVGVPLALGVLAVGCGRSEFRYVTDAETQTYLKVPREWAEFSEADVARAEARLAEQNGDDPPSRTDRTIERLLQWRVAFDADPEPSPLHVAGLSDDIVVDVRVRRLLDRERDAVNQASLRNLVVPYDELVQQEAQAQAARSLGETTTSDFRPLRDEELQMGGGLRGVRLTFDVRGEGGVYTIDQVALVDGRNERLWVLLVRASEGRYRAQQSRIDEIVESFTIEQKD
jgi:hypothetical protein